MRTLIDGYNLMYAMGLLGKRLGPDGLRKARHRFLNDLADALGPVDAYQTTVVFDASAPPGNAPVETRHKGLTVLFAAGDASADERIERLVAAHTSPKSLTVVSSDHRIRLAAARRKAQPLSTDEFWSLLEARKRRKPDEPPAPAESPARDVALSPQESSYWLNEFRELAEEPEVRKALASDPSLLTDAEIAEIEREIAQEEDPGPKHRRRSGPR